MIINHIGIYGICIRDNKLLCIKKGRGLYKNRLDLPGGSQKENEGLTIDRNLSSRISRRNRISDKKL